MEKEKAIAPDEQSGAMPGSSMTRDALTADSSSMHEPGQGCKPESAQTLARRGWQVFPLDAQTHIPLIQGWGERATTDLETICWSWSRKWSDAIVGIATGAKSDLIVIDVDVSKNGEPSGEETLAALESNIGPLPTTREIATPSGGRHLYFRHPGGYVKTGAGEQSGLGVNLDVRGDGGMVVAYRSRDDQESAELPPAWAKLLQSGAARGTPTSSPRSRGWADHGVWRNGARE
jgi:hypothetical protein